MMCSEEGGGQGEGRRGGGNVEVRSLTRRTFVLRHSIAISLCAIVIHLVHDDFFLSLCLCLSRILSASRQPIVTQNEWIQRTSPAKRTLFFWSSSRSQLYMYVFSVAYQTSEKTRRRDEEWSVMYVRVYVCFFFVSWLLFIINIY